ncbi:MAG: GNAT family N-acetyltransferase [Usitatibacteraceae bacterium]
MNDPDHVLVRKAVEADLGSVALLFDAYRQFYGFKSDREAAVQFLRRRLEMGDSVLLVAEMPNHDIAGFAQLYHGLSSLGMAATMIMNDLFVVPEYRGKGIAVHLLGAAKDEAKTAEIKTLSLSTQADNQVARTLYERDGWILDNDFIHYQATL